MSLIIGKNHVSFDELSLCPVPQARDRFVPLPHQELARLTKEALKAAGFEILEEDYVLTNDKMCMFGGFAIVRSDCQNEKRTLVCGIRNSNDNKFAASLCIGSKMLVCDNLCFSSERKLTRRHTTNIMKDLPRVIANTIAGLVNEWVSMEARIESYMARPLSFDEASGLVTRLVDNAALTSQKMYDVMKLWRNPAIAAEGMIFKSNFDSPNIVDGIDLGNKFDEAGYLAAVEAKKAELVAAFGNLDVWGLYNAVTEALKGSNVNELVNRTMKTQVIFDGVCGYSAPVVSENVNDNGTGDESADEQNFGETFEAVSEVVDNDDFGNTIEF